MMQGIEQVSRGKHILRDLFEEAGRKARNAQVTVLLRTVIHDGDTNWSKLPSRDILKMYEDIGVDRCIVTIPTLTDARDIEPVLERMAEALL